MEPQITQSFFLPNLSTHDPLDEAVELFGERQTVGKRAMHDAWTRSGYFWLSPEDLRPLATQHRLATVVVSGKAQVTNRK